MSLLLLTKLMIAPLFVGLITLIGRRAGPDVAGFLGALPVVAGPILALIVSTHGAAFGTTSALASAIGTVPTMLFALAFARLAPHLRPLPCLGAAYVVYFASAALAWALPVSWYAALAVPTLGWWLILRAFPAHASSLVRRAALRGDLPLRMLATLLLVAAVSHLADALGPQLAGIITPFPIITALLAVFTHAQAGARDAAMLLRALVRGLASFIAFFLVLGFLLLRASPVVAFACGIATCMSCHLAMNRFGIAAVRS